MLNLCGTDTQGGKLFANGELRQKREVYVGSLCFHNQEVIMENLEQNQSSAEIT